MLQINHLTICEDFCSLFAKIHFRFVHLLKNNTVCECVREKFLTNQWGQTIFWGEFYHCYLSQAAAGNTGNGYLRMSSCPVVATSMHSIQLMLQLSPKIHKSAYAFVVCRLRIFCCDNTVQPGSPQCLYVEIFGWLGLMISLNVAGRWCFCWCQLVLAW